MPNSLKGPYMLAGKELESPLLNAAGSINGPSLDNLIHEGSVLSETGIGGITYGSFTLPQRNGNVAEFGEPVFSIDEEQGKTWNSIGLGNIGITAALKIEPELTRNAHENGKVIIYSGSPVNAPEYGTSVEQAAQMSYMFLESGVDLVEINVSCPNVVTEGGGRKPVMGYDLQSMVELVDRLEDQVGVDQRLGVKLPPYVSEEDKAIVPDLAKLFLAKRVFRFLIACNALPGEVPTDAGGNLKPLSVPGGGGGLSGPYTAAVGREQVEMWHNQTAGEIDIVRAEGMDSGKELAESLRRGAKAGAGVTFLWRSSDWKQAVETVLFDFADEVAA